MSGFLPSDYSSASTPHNALSPTQYIFPVLKNVEILTCCSELELELTKAELTEPQRHRDRIRKVFWQLLDICFGITEEDLTRQLPSADELAQLCEYPELHEEHMLDLLFFRELSKCMAVVGIYDFSWRDLNQPTSKRFRTQMSAIINMAKFREEQLRKYYELMEPRNEIVNALQEVHNEHELLVEQLQKTQLESSVKMDEIDSVVRACQDLESEIAKSNKVQASKREEAAVLKREVNDLKDQLASTNWALQEAQAEEAQLSGQIVSSPSRRKGDLAAKEVELDYEKEEGRKLESEIEKTTAENARLEQNIQVLKNLIGLQKVILQEAQKNKKAINEIQETEKKISTNRHEIEEVHERTEIAERNLLRAEEKLQQTRKQAKMQMDAAHDRLDIAKEQLLVVEQERRDGMARVEDGEAEVRELEEKMKAEQEQNEQEIASLIAEYQETERAFLARHDKRMEFIEAAIQL
jgi:kinetochore protein Nuf2